MIKLLSLKFNNIGRFIEEQTIDFSNRDKLIQIDGKNIDTGGSSGAGKTTVFKALGYLLGIEGSPASSLQSRLTKKPIYVEGSFLINEQPVTIKRHKKDGLEIVILDEVISGNSKITEEKLDELIGIPRKIFRKMVYKPQKEGGFFLGMTPTEMYKFLITTLGLDIYVEKTEQINDNIKQYEKEVSELSSQINNCSGIIESTTGFLSQKQEPMKPVSTNYETIESEVKELSKQISDFQHEKASKLEKLVKPIAVSGTYDCTSLNEHTSRKSEVQDKIEQASRLLENLQLDINNILLTKQKASRLVDDIKQLKHQKSHIEHNECPTCSQHWKDDKSIATLQQIESDIQKHTDKILSFKSLVLQEPDIKNKMSKLKEFLAKQQQLMMDITAKISEEQSKKNNYHQELKNKEAVEQAQYNQQRAEITNHYDNILRTIESNRDRRLAHLNEHKIQLQNYHKAKEAYDLEVRSMTLKIKEQQNTLDSALNKKSELEHKTIVALEAKRLISSYIMQTFQDVLVSIGDIATHILSHIPNMQNSTIFFDGYKENKDGKLKEEITAIINMDGENEIPIKTLSGGERTSVDLAVDLAVIDIIETKSGIGGDFYIIDEPFDGLDAICREDCLEILTNLDTNKRIIVVDHSSELKQMVSDVITVIRSGENSIIQ